MSVYLVCIYKYTHTHTHTHTCSIYFENISVMSPGLCISSIHHLSSPSPGLHTPVNHHTHFQPFSIIMDYSYTSLPPVCLVVLCMFVSVTVFSHAGKTCTVCQLFTCLVFLPCWAFLFIKIYAYLHLNPDLCFSSVPLARTVTISMYIFILILYINILNIWT